MSDNMKKMYEYQMMNGTVSSEYVVRGAEVSCKYGSRTCVLNLPRDHGAYTSDGRPLITDGDSGLTNIRGFGMCNKDKAKPCKCEPKLNEWSVIEGKNLYIIDPKTNKGGRAVTQDSVTVCEKGGIVSFKTSGQASPSYNNARVKDTVEIVEDIKGMWSRSNDDKDFIGHVKVEHSGVYNFTITANKTGNRASGIVYVYAQNILGYITLVDEYTLKERTKESGESELYADVVLNRGKNYYFEVDRPDTNKMEYELKGNLDRHRLSYVKIPTEEGTEEETKEISGVWIIDEEYENMYPDNYERIVEENYHGITRSIYYLNPWYAMLLDTLITEMIKSREIPKMVSNILNIGITGLGVKYSAEGVVLAALLLGFDNFSDYELKKFSAKLNKAKAENSYLKIEIKSNRCAKKIIYEMDTPKIVSNDYYYDFSGCPALNIGTLLEGPKYEKGSFGMLYYFNSDTNPLDLLKELIEAAKDIKDLR